MRSNTQEVKAKIRKHIGEFYTPSELREQINGIMCPVYPTVYHAVYHMAEGGCFLIYNNDITAFIDSLGINPKGKEYDPYDSFKLYCRLIARDAQLIYKHAN